MNKIKKILLTIIIASFFTFPNKISASLTLLEDYFDNIDNNNIPYGWTEYSGSPAWSVIDEKYVGTVKPNDPYIDVHTYSGNTNWTNYSFEVDITGISGPDRAILFRLDLESSKLRKGYAVKYLESDIYPLSPNIEILGIKGDCYLKRVPVGSKVGDTHRIKVEAIDDNIKVYFDNTLKLDCIDTDPILNGNIGFWVQKSGAHDFLGNQYTNTTAYDNVLVKSIDSSAPPPIKKVVVVPGLGASWNTEGFLSCNPSGNYGDWTMFPFVAPGVYNPLIDGLNDARWEVETFFYDWRRNIEDNANLLSDFIEHFVQPEEGEKVHLVGHSMGGLVGRAYIDNKTEETNRVEKYISAGSPHQGTAIAYPAWSAGEVWNDNFLQKIAINALIKHCGLKMKLKSDRETIRAMAPSMQDLLPTFKYLVDRKTGVPKSLDSVSIENEWLGSSDFENDSKGSEVGTLSGNGFETLHQIKYKNRNKRDAFLGDWYDGKAAGKINSYLGDGTVIAFSSYLSNAEFNETLNQSHQNLVASEEGIYKILEFLGPYPWELPTLADTSFTEPESALLIIVHPADFLVNDPSGTIDKDTDGVVGVLNPKKGNYLLSINPETENTTLIVGQFLKNGQVLWKEYELEGKLPKIKTINIDPENPFEDPVN